MAKYVIGQFGDHYYQAYKRTLFGLKKIFYTYSSDAEMCEKNLRMQINKPIIIKELEL